MSLGRNILIAVTTFLLAYSVAHARLPGYDHIDPTKTVPERPLNQALAYFDKYKDQFKNQRFMVIIDYSKHSARQRFFLIDMKTGAVVKYRNAHGAGSDTNNDGYAERFSNVENSKASSLGFYRTLETYSGKHGLSLRLQGLSPTNSKAYNRAIVVHGAEYVNEGSAQTGRSWGCPALDMDYYRPVINRIKGGALMYGWSGQ